ncbi:MAG TPA: hypothetical protein VFR02_05885 [bacterium]|nr:hypothetical protein [bacterium]
MAFQKVAAAFAKDPAVGRKRVFASENVLTVKGKIFAMISSKGEFVVKLPRERVEGLVQARKGKRFEPGPGRVMKEWLAVKAPPRAWPALAQEAYDHVKKGQS